MGIVDIAIDRLRGVGYSVTRSLRGEMIVLDGVPSWTIGCLDKRGDAEVALPFLKGEHACVVGPARPHSPDVRVFFWRDDLDTIVELIRAGAVENARLAASASRVLVHADEFRDFSAGVPRRRGCQIALNDWSVLLLGWRLAMRFERHGELIPVELDGEKFGRYVARDYNAVRAGLVAIELEHEIAVHGHPLIQSPMGPLVIGIAGSPFGMTPIGVSSVEGTGRPSEVGEEEGHEGGRERGEEAGDRKRGGRGKRGGPGKRGRGHRGRKSWGRTGG